MAEEQQALCFMAGANAIFTGEKMLTTECNGWDEDAAIFGRWGLEPMKSFEKSGPREKPAESYSLLQSSRAPKSLLHARKSMRTPPITLHMPPNKGSPVGTRN